jgi:hypothetical protein
MLKEFLMRAGIKSQAKYVEMGYGQVEPNHLSAQRTAQIYAQLPADPSIEVLEQGQFVKYDYANGLVNFTGAGEWMLVYNEIKLYREHQLDCEFAMLRDNYQARVYSPLDGTKSAEEMYGPTRLLQGVSEKWDGSKFVAAEKLLGPDGYVDPSEAADFSVASKVHDYYEMNDINNPEIDKDLPEEERARRRLFMKLRAVKHPEAMMPKSATMVPRVFKTNVGDIFTTNMVDEDTLALQDELSPNAKGILSKSGDGSMVWQVVKVYNMPDFQRGVKIMRIK